MYRMQVAMNLIFKLINTSTLVKALFRALREKKCLQFREDRIKLCGQNSKNSRDFYFYFFTFWCAFKNTRTGTQMFILWWSLALLTDFICKHKSYFHRKMDRFTGMLLKS